MNFETIAYVSVYSAAILPFVVFAWEGYWWWKGREGRKSVNQRIEDLAQGRGK